MHGQTVVVIGGGVVGLSSALALLGPQRRVIVFERDARPARHSSWAGGGIVCPLWPWREPEGLWALVERSRALYPVLAAQLARETGIDVEYRLSGIEWQLNDSERSRAERWLRSRGLTVLDREDRLFCPDLGQVRNPRLGRALARAFDRRGGVLHCSASVRPWLDAGRVCGVIAPEGPVAADAVVLAAGAWASETWPAQPPAIFPVKGQMLLKRVPGAAVRPVSIGAEVYVIPRADDHVVIGSTVEHAGFDIRVTASARHQLLGAADRLAPWQAAAPVLGQWAGLRPGSRETLPVVASAATPGLWLNLGHYRNGITLAPACAEVLCQQMGYQSSLVS